MKIVFEGESVADLAAEAEKFLDGLSGTAPAAGAEPAKRRGRPPKAAAETAAPAPTPIASAPSASTVKPHVLSEADVVAAARAVLAAKSPAGDVNQDQGAQFLANLLATEFQPAVRVRGEGGLQPHQYEAFVKRVASITTTPAPAAANLI